MNTGRTSVLDRADQLIDANQSFCDGDRSLLIDVDLPVVDRLNSLVRRRASRSVTLRLTVATGVFRRRAAADKLPAVLH